MRKRLLIALGATVALVAAATAYAAFTATGITGTTAMLTTTTASDVKTRQCTGGDGKAFTITDAKFTGTAVFTNPVGALDGPASFRVKTTVDDTSKLGYVEGSVKVKDDDTDFHGRFVGTLDATGKFAGFLTGDAHKGSKANVLGTLSGTFAGSHGLREPGCVSRRSVDRTRRHRRPGLQEGAEAEAGPAGPAQQEVRHPRHDLGDRQRPARNGHGRRQGPDDGDVHGRRQLALDLRLRPERQGQDEVRADLERLVSTGAEEGRSPLIFR